MPSEFSQIISTREPTEVAPLTQGKFGALLVTYSGGLQAVVKQMKYETPNGRPTQRGLPVFTLPRREVAFYELAKLLGLEHLVPETVLTAFRGKEASAQLYLPALHAWQIDPRLKQIDPHDEWRANLKEVALKVRRHHWRRLVVLDLIAASKTATPTTWVFRSTPPAAATT